MNTAVSFRSKNAIRSYEGDRDRHGAIALINQDRLQGQSVCMPEMLNEAIAGRSKIDAGWWHDLDPPQTLVLTRSDGELSGIIATARRKTDGTGIILWLHAREDRATIHHLLFEACQATSDAETIEAFAFATALTAGLEALPVQHRPNTRQALLNAGFTEHDLWRYMRLDLKETKAVAPCGQCSIMQTAARSWTITLTDAKGAAHIEILPSHTGVVWWIEVCLEDRGKRIGLRLLNAAVHLLKAEGAHDVILYVDDDASGPGRERDRTAANGLYDRVGFREVDRLMSYRRQRIEHVFKLPLESAVSNKAWSFAQSALILLFRFLLTPQRYSTFEPLQYKGRLIRSGRGLS